MLCNYLHLILLSLVAGATGAYTPLSFVLFLTDRTADPNDWVNPDYVQQAASGKTNADVSTSQNTIASKADSTASKGPYSKN